MIFTEKKTTSTLDIEDIGPIRNESFQYNLEEVTPKDIDIQTEPNVMHRSQVISASRRTDIPAWYLNKIV